MSTEITYLGPDRELVPEWVDPDTGDIYPEHWVQVLRVEAPGTDGLVYSRSLTAGLEFPAEGWDSMYLHLAVSLKESMRREGAWEE